jgi:hypothetical protein
MRYPFFSLPKAVVCVVMLINKSRNSIGVAARCCFDSRWQMPVLILRTRSSFE